MGIEVYQKRIYEIIPKENNYNFIKSRNNMQTYQGAFRGSSVCMNQLPIPFRLAYETSGQRGLNIPSSNESFNKLSVPNCYSGSHILN